MTTKVQTHDSSMSCTYINCNILISLLEKLVLIITITECKHDSLCDAFTLLQKAATYERKSNAKISKLDDAFSIRTIRIQQCRNAMTAATYKYVVWLQDTQLEIR